MTHARSANLKSKSKKFFSNFSNIEIVTLAVYLIGGDSKYIDTEDVAIKVNDLAPGRFVWVKYPGQINIENVRKRLSDSKNPNKAGYLIGSTNKGWMLTEKGLYFCKSRINDLENIDISRPPIDPKLIKWQKREKTRMTNTSAFKKVLKQNYKDVSKQEAEAFFRLDEYITGKAREKKLNKYLNLFGDDPSIAEAVINLSKRIRENGE